MDVSKHAYQRARERLSWSRDTTDRMSKRAWVLGVTGRDTNGKLKQYIDRKLQTYVGVEYIRIYGEYLYLYGHDTLITVYGLPNDLVRLIPK